MSVLTSLQNLSNLARVRFAAAPALQRGSALQTPVSTAAPDFRIARSRLLALFDKLQELAELVDVSSRFRLDLPDARSAASLGLDLTTTAASLASTEEINATPASFAPFGPEWSGLSDALITIDGAYDGSNGSDVLTIEARRTGIHGVNDLRLWLNDSQGSRLQNINISRSDPLDQVYDLGNGLLLSLGAGGTLTGDTATLQVYDNVGAAVDPDKPLGGVRNNKPNLQFGSPAIVDGEFTVNGAAISVSTSDSISTVVNRINQSSAGVTASFNAGTETIDFLQDTTGSAPTIELAGGTSNFLAATKLSGAIATPGIDPDTGKRLEDVAVFTAVNAGSFLINGREIAIDPSGDSLDTVLARINESAAGVTAAFDSASQRVVIEADDAATELIIDSNGTGLFAALRIAEGRVDPEARAGGLSRARSYRIADATAAAFAEINALFRDATFEGGSDNIGAIRGPLESALRATFGAAISDTLFGLVLDGSAAARLRGDLASVDRAAFTRQLQLRGDAVQSVLLGTDGRGGIVTDLLRATGQALATANKALGIAGTRLDTFA